MAFSSKLSGLVVLGLSFNLGGCRTTSGSGSEVAAARSSTAADLCYAVSHDVDANTDSDEDFQDKCVQAVKDAGLTRKADIVSFVCGKAETFNYDYSSNPTAKLKASLRQDCQDSAAGKKPGGSGGQSAAAVKKATDSLCYDVSHYVDANTDSDEDFQNTCVAAVDGAKYTSIMEATAFVCRNAALYNYDAKNDSSKGAGIRKYCTAQAAKLQ